jgi:hypothetical protein
MTICHAVKCKCAAKNPTAAAMHSAPSALASLPRNIIAVSLALVEPGDGDGEPYDDRSRALLSLIG